MEPKCPLTDQWIKKMWYIYTTEHYSATKGGEIISVAATQMDLEVIILSEVSQKEKDMLLYDITYMWNQNMTLIYEQKQIHRHREQTCDYQRGEGKSKSLE